MDLSKLKLPDLKALCKQKGIQQYSKCNKQQLIDKLTAAGITAMESGVAVPIPARTSTLTSGSSQSQTSSQTQPLQSQPQIQSQTQSQPQASNPAAPTPAFGPAETSAVTSLAASEREPSNGEGSASVDGSSNNRKGKKGGAQKEKERGAAVKGKKGRGTKTAKADSAPLVEQQALPALSAQSRISPKARVISSDTSQTSAPTSLPQDAVNNVQASSGQVSATASSHTVSEGLTLCPTAKLAETTASKSAGKPPDKPCTTDPMPNARSKALTTPAVKPICTPKPVPLPSPALKAASPVSLTQKKAVPTAPNVAVNIGVKRPSNTPVISVTPAKRARVQLQVTLKPSSVPGSVVKPSSAPSNSISLEDESTPNDTYIRTHFVSALYSSLDAARARPTRKPYSGLNAIVKGPIPAFRAAIRFVVARLHTQLQLGKLDLCVVKECTHANGDVWRIKLEGDEEHHFIGTTGEPIPHERSDWAAYIKHENPKHLLRYVRTKDGKPHTARPDEGLAERIVLANCALNSFSGDKVSSLQMDSECLGQPAPHKSAGLDFYLAESHQLLSLHPTPHPAVIITYLRHGSFYVLKETGQQIGDEEGDGIVELWQGLLGCNHKGRPDDRIAQAFWNGWEERYAALQLLD